MITSDIILTFEAFALLFQLPDS